MTCLTYFDLPGRAEATRIALAVGGVEFEDKRVSFEEYVALRSQPNTKFPFLPILEVDGEHFGQSTSLLRYAGKRAGLYPEDAMAAMKVDEIVMEAEDVNITLFGTMSAENPQQVRAELSAGGLKTRLENLAAKLQANSSSVYFVGDSLTIADLQVYAFGLTIKTGYLEGFAMTLVADVAPALQAHHEAVSKHPKVAAYYASKTS